MSLGQIIEKDMISNQCLQSPTLWEKERKVLLLREIEGKSCSLGKEKSCSSDKDEESSALQTKREKKDTYELHTI